MRFSWTIKELNEVSDHKLLETLITERQSTCTNCYAPLYQRLSQLRANHDKISAPTYAAAPDLLDACKLALRETLKPGTDPLVKQLKEAIAKAATP